MPIEIIGRACLAPGASDPEELFELLAAGRNTVTEIPDERWDKARYWHPEIGVQGKTYTFAAGVLEDILGFDAAVFGMSPREAESLDPQQRLILRMTWRAFESANLAPSSLASERVGVYIGASSLEYGNLFSGDPAAASPYFMTGNTLSVVSNRISHVFGLHGPSLTVDTACSSGLVALDLAVKALEAGEIETAIVGSVNALAHPLSFVGFAQARMLSINGQCRAYDDRAEGYVRSEGGAVFILRRADRARAAGDRSYASILASGMNSAGRTNFISLPSGGAQAALLGSIYGEGRVDAGSLAFVEGHGTGTRVGDPAEVFSVGQEIGRRRSAPIPIGSIKTNIGHTEPASGLLGLMKAMLALEHNFLPASLHFDQPNRDIDFEGLNVRVAADPINLLPSRKSRLAAVNSFGFGGTNAHVVITDPPAPVKTPAQGEGHLFLVSAQTRASLEAIVASHRGRIASLPERETAAYASAAGANRQHLRHRFAVPIGSRRALEDSIDAFLRGGEEPLEALRDQAKTAFVFVGNGSQWAGMGIDALRDNGTFRKYFEVTAALFRNAAEIDLHELLHASDLEARLADTRVAQPLLFALQAALSDTLVEMGLRPAALFGHSIGEVAAAYAAGALSLVDAVEVVTKRSRHQHEIAGRGKMIAVSVSPPEAMRLAEEAGLASITVAGANAPNAVTLSGTADDVAAFRAIAADNRLAAQILDIDYPFHHPIIDEVQDAFLADLPALRTRNGTVPFISTVTGDVLDGTMLDPSYWWMNIREPVAFEGATRRAIDMGCTVFIEIGPRPILSSYVRETLRAVDAPGTVLPSLVRVRAPQSDPVSHVFARAVGSGAAFSREAATGRRNAFVNLPALPFELSSRENERTVEALDIFGRNAPDRHQLVGWRVDGEASTWHNHVDAHLYADLAQHVVDERPILPASAFIEMMLDVGRQHFEDHRFEITNLEILAAMDLSASRMLEVITVLSPETGTVKIKSRERLKDGEWATHAVARLRQQISLDVWPENASEAKSVIDASRVYDTARRFGLAYGEHFRLLRSAQRIGETELEVDLRSPFRPTHPFLRHTLDPASTDAAFHGLVGLFDELVEDHDNAPYIPVRFGKVQLHLAGREVRRARIRIERVSRFSVRASVRLFDAEGHAVATLSDCRFRRTRLRPRRPLDTSTFHYDLVPTRHQSLRLARKGLAALQHAPASGQEQSEGAMLLEAASYRMCFDVVTTFAKGARTVLVDALDGGVPLGVYLHSCIFHLEAVGLAQLEADRWRLEDDGALPAFDALFNSVFRECPERSVEAVLLNQARADALRLVRAGFKNFVGRSDEAGRAGFSKVSLDHAWQRSPAALERQNRLLGDLRNLADPAIHVLELGATSIAFSSRIADIVAAEGGHLTVVEPDEHLQSLIALAFRHAPHVRVESSIPENSRIDLVASASDHCFDLFEKDPALLSALSAQLDDGSAMLLEASAPNVFADAVFGLEEGWFARSLRPSFPVGSIADADDWRRLLAPLRRAVDVREYVGRHGGAVRVWSEADEERVSVAEPKSLEAVWLTMTGGKNLPDQIELQGLSGNEAQNRLLLSQLLDQASSRAVVCISGADPSRDPSDLLNERVSALTAVAKELAARSSDGLPARLAVVLPGGAPKGKEPLDPVNAGLWAFLRVVRNEYPDLAIHSVDAAVDANCRGLVSKVLLLDAPNREWVVETETGRVSEMRVVPGPLPAPLRRTSSFEAAVLHQDSVSQIGHLRWQPTVRSQPRTGEVEIAIAGTALNYRDVMWAIGILPEEALEDGFAGPSVGMECAGRVTAIGEGVSGLAIGDSVMAVAANAFATHVTAPAAGVAKLPLNISPIAGATIPVVFLTAWYGLVELGRIRAGETVLIHGGAGGVGLAALQIATSRGATVIATAGSSEKRSLLETLGAHRVLDSRSLGFTSEVMRITKGEGVDLVLNSLFGEAMERSIALLKPFGRFLELGKRDYYGDSKIGLRPFRRNISYFGIDADQLLKARPDVAARLFGELAAEFETGRLAPVAFRCFAYDEVRDAFRLMQSSGHIGKIVVTPPVAGRDAVPVTPRLAPALDAAGFYLVAGGTSGFAFEAARWLIARGARKIALCSRRGSLDGARQAEADGWKASGVEVVVEPCDITDQHALSELLGALRQRAPLKGVVHAAMVLDDALLDNLDAARNRPVIDVKAKGAVNLDRLTRADALDTFLMFSSVTTAIGNIGQANYVAGNGFLEGLARKRRAEGLPALAVCFGGIADVGALAADTETRERLAKRLGKYLMTALEALHRVEEVLAQDDGDVSAAAVVVADLDFAALHSLPVVSSPLFEVPLRTPQGQTSAASDEKVDLAQLIAGRTSEEAERLIMEMLIGEIASALRIARGEIGPTSLVRAIGVDSLMAMELGMNFQQKTGLDLPLSSVGETTTVAEIARRLQEKVSSSGVPALSEEKTLVEEKNLVNRLVGSHSREEKQRASG